MTKAPVGSRPRRPGIQQGAQGDAKIDVAGLQRGVSLHVAGRYVVEHDDVGGTLRAAGRCFRRELAIAFDQLQARPNMVDQADEVGNHGAVGGILVVGRMSTPSPAALCIGALLTLLF